MGLAYISVCLWGTVDLVRCGFVAVRFEDRIHLTGVGALVLSIPYLVCGQLAEFYWSAGAFVLMVS